MTPFVPRMPIGTLPAPVFEYHAVETETLQYKDAAFFSLIEWITGNNIFTASDSKSTY